MAFIDISNVNFSDLSQNDKEFFEAKLVDSQSFFDEFKRYQLIYHSALREVNTKLEILNDEFQSTHEYNPIEHMKSRVKSPKSLIEKLIRKNLPIDISLACETLTDLAGIRVICSFIDDIYKIADMLTEQDDVTLIKVKDYIKNPKPNGYRSLHLVISIPVFFSNKVQHVAVEIQIRTVAMDFWASLEHKLKYKYKGASTKDIASDLKECADQISQLDQKMMSINHIIHSDE